MERFVHGQLSARRHRVRGYRRAVTRRAAGTRKESPINGTSASMSAAVFERMSGA